MPENTTKNKRKSANSVRSQITISRVSVEKTSRTLVVKLPLAAAKYLNLGKARELFAVPINGVVQLSGFQPNIALPAAKIVAEDFVEQP
jgi:hypothetical protein